MYQLPPRRTLWSRHVADRLERLTADRRSAAGASLPSVLGLR